MEKQKRSVDDCRRHLFAIRRWSGDTYCYTATLVGDGRSFRHLAPRERIIARRTGPPVLRLGVSARLVAGSRPLAPYHAPSSIYASLPAGCCGSCGCMQRCRVPCPAALGSVRGETRRARARSVTDSVANRVTGKEGKVGPCAFHR